MSNSEKTATKRGRPFKPGQSGNPEGRPKKEWTWRGLLMDAAEGVDPESGLTVKQVAAAALVSKAAAGDVQALKEFGDRVDGKPSQGIDVTSKGERIGTADAAIAAIDSSRKAA